jgi:hypothetical protein
MTKPYTHSWTPEKLAAQDRKTVDALRKNAVRLGAHDLIEMCDVDLEARTPKKEKRTLGGRPRAEGDVVTGYHFVCQRDRGVTPGGENQFWSGSWVVAEANVRASMKFGAYLALHETKSQLSYRQGQILGYRCSPRDMLSEIEEGGKIEEGIEFLVQETSEPYAWVGAGAGEKGYRWASLVTVLPEPSNS